MINIYEEIQNFTQIMKVLIPSEFGSHQPESGISGILKSGDF